jgi:hypothetical protein
MHQFQTDHVKKRYPLYFKVANYYRNKRFNLFVDTLKLDRDAKILDVGGTYEFWENVTEFNNITVLNILKTRSNHRIQSVVFQGGKFPFKDQEFDAVFSNSTIEHVGDFWDQLLFAEEVRRCGKKYFVQVPSYWSPYEPHAMIPWYQYMPAPVKILLRKYIPRSPYPIEELLSIRLLTKSEIKLLFPSASLIITERMLGIPKSYFIIKNKE